MQGMNSKINSDLINPFRILAQIRLLSLSFKFCHDRYFKS